MQLLHSAPIPVPQFAALSLLLPDGMVEPLLTVAPTCTVSKDSAQNALQELHRYLVGVLEGKGDSLDSECMSEDERSLRAMQIFRPTKAANGIGLYYRFLKNDTATIQTLIQSSNISEGNSTPAKIDPSAGVLGVVLTVGVSGFQPCTGSSLTCYDLPQRISDCCNYLLMTQRFNDVQSAKALLTSFLLNEGDYRMTNETFMLPHMLTFPSSEEERRNMLSPMGMITPIAEFGRKQRRASMTRSSGKETGHPEDLGLPLHLERNSADSARFLTDRLTVLSVADTDCQLRKYDQTGLERRANLDLAGAKGRFRRRKPEARGADFDNFDYKGPTKSPASKPIPSLGTPTIRNNNTPEASKLQLSKKDTRKGNAAVRRGTLDATIEEGRPSQNGFDPFFKSRNRKPQFDDEYTLDSRSLSGNQDGGSIMSQQRSIQVSLALNEDLACSYKLSQLSSCTIEGVVQVQARSAARPSNIPFSLLVRDMASHIDTLNENRKFVELANRNKDDDAVRYEFNVTIPKQDTYFPLLKYKCTGDLRPVPLRVQTKVKSEGGYCRVALQISSNPNNDASLSDLTIVMGVPDKVRGETLATQPAGGVWDKPKSSVIWCVSELGGGEKFQLQARFATVEDVPASELTFPVLVRCQCLHQQVSDIEFDARENPDAFSADIALKVSKRYRLSHREKNV